MAKHGKKYNAVQAKVKSNELYTLSEALEFLKVNSYTKFDETVDIAMRLGVNPRHADQIVRGTVVLPHGTGKTSRVVVFAKGEKITEAQEAGADFVGGDELIEKVTSGWLDFDAAVATPDMMAKVGKLGKILGPRGLMPNPKTGTVTFELANAIRDIKGGKIAFRVDKAGIIHAPLGKISFDVQKLFDNAKILIDNIIKLKPATAKGTYILNITISSTMGVGLKLDIPQVMSLFR